MATKKKTAAKKVSKRVLNDRALGDKLARLAKEHDNHLEAHEADEVRERGQVYPVRHRDGTVGWFRQLAVLQGGRSYACTVEPMKRPRNAVRLLGLRLASEDRATVRAKRQRAK